MRKSILFLCGGLVVVCALSYRGSSKSKTSSLKVDRVEQRLEHLDGIEGCPSKCSPPCNGQTCCCVHEKCEGD